MLPESDTLQQEEEIHLRDYLQVVLRRKWIIIAFFVVSVTIVAIKSFKATPIYKTSVQILVDKENPNVISFEEVMSMDGVDSTFIQTQLKIIGSRALARRVIKSLNLKDSPEFKSDGKSKGFSIRGFIRGLLSTLLKKKDSKNKSLKTDKIDEDSGLVSSYLSRLKAESIRNSRMVNISFEGSHPDIIKTIANRHAREYIAMNLEMRFAASQDAVEWLQKQLYEKKESVEKAENALQLYKEKKKIVSLEDRQNIIVQKLEELNSTLTTARIQRIEIETLYNQTKKYSGDPELIESIPNVMNNPLIQVLKKDYVKLRMDIINLSDKYGKRHPNIIRIMAEAKELESRINSEVNKIIRSIETDYKVALSREESLSVAMEEQKGVALDLNRKAIAYGTLQREAESERAMYDILLKRMKETDITGELKTSNIRIVDPAEIPRTPIKPKKKLNILLAAVVGLTLGVGLAFFLEYIDNTVKSPEDVERFLNTTLLGVLEKVRIPKSEKQVSLEILTHEMPKSTFAEAMRNVRTSIMLSSTDNPKRSLLVTSAQPGEGKTFIASNLAIIIAKTGKKTLLVDADFRKPRVHNVFDIETLPGLSNHLIGESDLESIIKPTAIPNLSIVTCGLIPPNPSEMLGSHSMETFCKSVKERFDTVIFDTPPAMTVTDAVVLSNIVNGVIYVIKSGEATKEMVKRSILQLSGKKSEMLGVVMNSVDVSRGGYYHYYSRYYKYGYGYGSEEGSKKNKKRKMVKAEEKVGNV